MRFENKTVIIASSGGSIGLACCRMLQAEGARVVFLAARPEELAAQSGTYFPLAVRDFADEGQMRQAEQTVREAFGSWDVIVTCLWDEVPEGVWNEIPEEQLRRPVTAILTGTRTVLQFFLPELVEKESGRVVILTSIVGRTNIPGESLASAMAYAGLGGLIRNAARVYGKKGITVNGVAVGPVEGMYCEPAVEACAQGILGRPVSAKDAANAVMYLADDMAAWNTGEILDLNGGRFAL